MGWRNRFLCFIFVLLFTPWFWRVAKTTNNQSLIHPENNQQAIEQAKLRRYPPVYIQFGSKKKLIPIGHWLETRPETIAFYRIRKNFFELIDPNLYFFANHPRERAGVKEFEKLPFFFLPFFVNGLIVWIKRKTKWYWWGLVVLPIAFLSLVTTDGLLYWLKARTRNAKKK